LNSSLNPIPLYKPSSYSLPFRISPRYNINNTIPAEVLIRLYSEFYPHHLSSSLFASFPTVPSHDLISASLPFSQLASYNFSHPGISSDVYKSHVLRVALILNHHNHRLSTTELLATFFHNIYELDPSFIHQLRALLPARLISLLGAYYFNRHKRDDHAYLSHYYDSLAHLGPFAINLKAADKLDNLPYLIYNKNTSSRDYYLAEISQYLLPLLRSSSPSLYQSIQTVINLCSSHQFRLKSLDIDRIKSLLHGY